MVNRREFLGIAAGAGATLAFTPQLLRALQQGKLIERAIPSSGERLPAVGLSFSNHVSCADHAALRDVFKTFVDNGGRVFDAMHGNAQAEQFHATVASELGVQNKLFWSTRGTPPGGPGGPPPPGAATVNAHVDTWLARTTAPKLDLVMLPVQGDPTWLAALKEEKKAGRVRHIGVQTISVNFQSAQLETIMRNEPIDFIGVDYDASNRKVEETILPLAQERKIGVMAFFPFSNNGGTSCGAMSRNLFARVGTTPLPSWAAEFDARTWAQFFLKYVVSHPAITVVRAGTEKATHMLDNIGGGSGRLPNEATRKRMAQLVDAFPPAPVATPPGPPPVAVPAAILDRYVGEYTGADEISLTFRRGGTTLFVKPPGNPEIPLVARSETRFSVGPAIIEFQLDGDGKVTGAIMQQGPQRIPLTRK